jgi:hypothetical protein
MSIFDDMDKQVDDLFETLDKAFRPKSAPVGVLIKWGNGDYETRIETTTYDYSKNNPSLPVCSSIYKGRSTTRYGLTEEEGINHIRSFGYTGKIIYRGL